MYSNEYDDKLNRLIELLIEGVNLSDAEILTILLRDISPVVDSERVAKMLVDKYDTLADICSLPYVTLCETEGVAKTGAILLKTLHRAFFSIAKSNSEVSIKRVSGEREAVAILKPYFEFLEIERFYVMLLDKRRRLIDVVEISRGTGDSIVVDKKVLLETIIKHKASAVLFAHNHFITTIPSINDVSITKDLIVLLKALSIEFCDHIIFCDGAYSSMRESGHLKEIL